MKQKRLPWKRIAAQFNEEMGIPHCKKASQCSERWKNVLANKCKKFVFNLSFTKIFRGEWTKREDMTILDFVMKNGTKWSKLIRICPKRTEHNVKNRFFSLIAKHFDRPILKIKKSCNYLDLKVLEEVKQGLGREWWPVIYVFSLSQF